MVDLALPVIVVVKPQRREADAVAVGIRAQAEPVLLQPVHIVGGGVQVRGIRHEDVHAEPDARLACGPYLLAHRRDSFVPGREEAEAAGAVNCCNEAGSRRPAGHGCRDDPGAKQGMGHCLLLETTQ